MYFTRVKRKLLDMTNKVSLWLNMTKEMASMQPTPVAEKSFPLQRNIILLKELKKVSIAPYSPKGPRQ